MSLHDEGMEKTTRRGLLSGGLSAAAVLVTGCGRLEVRGQTAEQSGGGDPDEALLGGGSGSGEGGAPAAHGESPHVGAGGWPSADIDAGASCAATRPDIEGPFFAPSSPERGNLRDPDLAGTSLVVTGRVLDADCRPIAGAVLDFWQADADGVYDNVGFRLRGHQRTDADGRYLLETIVPGHYLNGSQYRPAHLHVKLAAPARPLLTTQLYFEGDPHNAVDPWFSEETMLRLAGVEGRGLYALFDFVAP